MSPARALGAAIALVCVLACASRPEPWDPAWAAPYGELAVEARLEFGRARADAQAGRLREAWRRLDGLFAAQPDQLDLGVALQEIERELLRQGAEGLAALPPPGPGADPVEVLRLRYDDRAKASPSVAAFVLVARVETDWRAALNYLERALELDPGCAWAHYGRAHVLLQAGGQYRWREARRALEQALRADSGHLPARRLEAWMLAQEGGGSAAITAYQRWLAVSEGDPRVDRATRTRARVDLARLWLVSGEVAAARDELAALEGDPVDRERRLGLLVVVEQEGGDVAAAVQAARRARLAGTGSLLPLVQEALLEQYWNEDLEAAAARWEEVARAVEGRGDLASLVQGFRARVAQERIEAARAAAASARAGDADEGGGGDTGGDLPR